MFHTKGRQGPLKRPWRALEPGLRRNRHPGPAPRVLRGTDRGFFDKVATMRRATDPEEAQRTLELLRELGEAQAELEAMRDAEVRGPGGRA